MAGVLGNPIGYKGRIMDDLNKIVSSGIYLMDKGSYGNRPFENLWTFITVYNQEGNITQIATEMYGSQQWARGSGDAGNTWSVWTRL